MFVVPLRLNRDRLVFQSVLRVMHVVPMGSWSCSIGDATTFPCDGQLLVKGIDSFGTPCCDAPDPCICTKQYEPVCCGGITFGNQCEANCECATGCTQGACSKLDVLAYAQASKLSAAQSVAVYALDNDVVTVQALSDSMKESNIC
eukprot:TRINITY_DN15380_c0_g1_i1.p1 TRINITY_DN15380_c0_g1~~TRINITY_DN15380_c0_g1_i1.p1  ORF type:complete len:146 (+),score=17.04 TRINITY_DN15380_c0_g1_i1:25-462(+)